MYSIVEIKGKQYKAVPGKEIEVDRIEAKEGDAYKDIKVLLLKDDKNQVQVGQPYLDKVGIKAKVVGQTRADKVVAVRYKPKSGYVKSHGHRQPYTRLMIEEIKAGA